MAHKRSGSFLGSVLRKVRENRGLALPTHTGKARMPLQLMHTPSLDREYMGDLRVSARDRGTGSFLK